MPAADISHYIAELDKLYRAGNATEHSYRPALKTLFEKITFGLTITNEPKHIACGAPDYIIIKDTIPLGYIEAKDIPVGIDNKQNKKQFDRYRQSLGNLIITDYLTFRLFVDGEQVATVTIASESSGGIMADKNQFSAFLELIDQFTRYSGKTIYNSEQLAKMMAAKAKLLAETITAALNTASPEQGSLQVQYEAFKKVLIHNLGITEFAGIYAQTLAYGLFAARLNQQDSQPFTRYLAPRLIPQSNPFLRKFFNYIAGIELDSRIAWIVDALADLFNCVAVEDIKKEFDKTSQDPYIHFYETFLAEYDPALRETRGVYYTPLPVVKFIVQAVDDILKTEFGLKSGLADYSKIKRSVQGKDGKPETVELHRVQILDPAAGTGTFLAEVIDRIFSYFAKNKGAWPGYCENHLIPRLHGFEILMASYAMAHFKLDMKLKETGFSFKDESRLRVFLTNSLEEPENVAEKLPMVEWLTQEANEASKVKRNTPVMIVLGNPPYNVSSMNRGKWIQGLIADYKNNLNEKKINLDDDYIKFIRYGQFFIEKNASGILAYISNNSFIDGITHREMRKSLLETFDKLYILDLHGSSKKKETDIDGSPDTNVFDIQQGVSISIFIKTGHKANNTFAKVYHSELFGKRETKYTFLLSDTISSIKWTEINPVMPYYFFVPKNFANRDLYEKGFSIQELFCVFNNGIKTDRDPLFIDFEKKPLENRIRTLFSRNYSKQFIDNFNVNDSTSYKLKKRIDNKTFNFNEKHIAQILYRPFDYRYIYYQPGLTSRPAYEVMKHMFNDNVSLLSCRQQSTFDFQHAFISKSLSQVCTVSLQTKETAYVFPLYLYPDENSLDKDEKRRPNLNTKIVQLITDKTGLQYTKEKLETENTFAPIDMLDYIYVILYSNNYRTKYAEFFKIDFPRIPYPENAEQFQKLASIGSLLRNLHLMENVSPSMDLATFPIAGTNEIEKVDYKADNVYINEHQYFENIPPHVWEYYIGGYRPAEKWLKDRKGRELSFDDIEHYQKIIFVLEKTIEIQWQIDEIAKT